jgi:hypothetical protein
MVNESAKRFLIILFFAVATTVILAWYRFVYTRNYDVVMQIPCDPTAQSCFVSTCDSLGAECSGDSFLDTHYYSLLRKAAYSIPSPCDPNTVACQDALVCHDGETRCVATYCDTSTVEEDARCSDASDILFIQDRTAEEESL